MSGWPFDKRHRNEVVSVQFSLSFRNDFRVWSALRRKDEKSREKSAVIKCVAAKIEKVMMADVGRRR